MAAKGSWEQGCGCVDRTSASTFPRQIFPRTAVLCHQRRLFWAAASPRCDRCKLSRLAMQLTGRLMQAPSLPTPRSFHNFNHLLRSASMRLHAPLCASLNPHQPPTPSQGGTSDSNGRVRTSRFCPANHKNCRRALVCAICLLLDSFDFDSLTLDSLQQIIMQLGPPASRAGFALSRNAKLRTVDHLRLSEASRRLACAMGFIRTKDNAQSTFVGSPSRRFVSPFVQTEALPSRLLAIKI